MRNKNTTVKKKQEEKDMSFFDHLEELRWHIIRSLVVIITVGIVLFINNAWFFDVVLFGPTKASFISYRWFCDMGNAIGLGDSICFSPPYIKKQAIGFAEAFTTSISVSFIAGFIVAFPYVFWEFWRFISPGLYKHEKNAARGVVFICSFLFILGVSFGYFIIAPFAVNFLTGFTIPGVENTPTLDSYLNYIIMFTLPTGLVFELPVVAYFLAHLGILGPQSMRDFRRHAFVVVLIVAAVITPPDAVSQCLIAIPLYGLYEVSILVAARVTARREKKELEEEEADRKEMNS